MPQRRRRSATYRARVQPAAPPVFPFHYRRRVEFADTDQAGIAHFSNLLRYAESAEHAALRAIGERLGAAGSHASGLGWPRVHLEADFKSPLRFEEVADMEVVVQARSARSVTWGVTIRKVVDDAPGPLVAVFKVVSVCITEAPRSTGPLSPIAIPDALAAWLVPA